MKNNDFQCTKPPMNGSYINRKSAGTFVTVSTETQLNVLDQNSRKVAQYFRASHICIVLVKNAKPGFCCHGHNFVQQQCTWNWTKSTAKLQLRTISHFPEDTNICSFLWCHNKRITIKTRQSGGVLLTLWCYLTNHST